MFFSKKVKATLDIEILFGSECNLYGSHGTLIMDHRESGVFKKQIRFYFKGLLTPPALNPQVLNYLFVAAEDKGYVPYELSEYGEVIPEETESEPEYHNDLVVSIHPVRDAYFRDFQNGYNGTFQQWKDSRSKVKENADRFEKQLARQRAVEESA